MTVAPLVSCIMPTADRRRFVPLAIEYFLRQDYAPRELLVVDDGRDPVEDLIPADARIRYLRVAPGMTLGAKRNWACEQARGEIVAHWDDDDWHAPRRLSVQMEAMRPDEVEVCGIDHLLFFHPDTGRAWEYRYPREQRRWLSGSSLVYRRRFWETHPFPSVNVGEDARFVWSGAPERMRVLPDHTFHVGMMHDRNTSPKRTRGRWWTEVPAAGVLALMGADAAAYSAAPATIARVASPVETPAPARPSLHNVFACLVHEKPECVIDLVRNLRHLDPDSTILLYNGGPDTSLLRDTSAYERLGAVVHPTPQPAKWGTLHGFALDSMRFARELGGLDTLTIVDSDQLALRPGYSPMLAAHLHGREGVGMLVNSPGVQPRNTRVAPAVTAWREVERWRPFLRRFPDGESKWVHWSFWPSTVFTADACRALVGLFERDEELRSALSGSGLWATEEILFPTLTALLGFGVEANPCSYDYVKYRVPYSAAQLATALRRDDAWWMHPVPRRYDHALRRQVRERFTHYHTPRAIMTPATATPPVGGLFLTLPVIAQMKTIEGWLDEDEADLLIAAVRLACPDGAPLGAIVEVGSYCGRSTVVLAHAARAFGPGARITAIDPHLGVVGAADQGVKRVAPSRDRFLRNIASAGVADLVDLVQQHSTDVSWSSPIGLLFIDGLHDYLSVSRDLAHFAPWIARGGYVAFHDYADYYPGVRALVDEVVASGEYEVVRLVRSMMLLRRAR